MDPVVGALVVVVVGIVTFLLGRISRGGEVSAIKEEAAARAEAARREAEAQAQSVIREAEVRAKEVELDVRRKIENDLAQDRKELAEDRSVLVQERRRFVEEETALRFKDATLERRTAELDQRARDLTDRDAALARQQDETRAYAARVAEMESEALGRIVKVAGMTPEDAKAELMRAMEDDARHEAASTLSRIETETKEQAEAKAKKIIATAIQRFAGDHISEASVTVVPIPSDDIKGRIIGREGRNIRSLESMTGVDFIVDDTPQSITVSAFNPIRREVARLAIEKLVSDGRINPGRIEDAVKKSEEEVDAEIKKAGEQALFDTGVHGVHPEISKLVGKLKYRYSYGQNQWKHAIETSFICGAMAAELGLNEPTARRAGLLHDIGKTIVHDQEGSHALLGAAAAKRYGEHPKIIHAIAAHHEEEKPQTMLAALTAAADSLSGARPGARMEAVESYFKRLEELEGIATAFTGVDKCFAIQAGRELRVIVSAERVTESDSTLLASDIAKKIEKDLTYPGQIKITVIRETRAVEFAR